MEDKELLENENVKKKSHKGLIIFIILLILIILGLVGYICYDKGLIFKKVEEKEIKEEAKKETKNEPTFSELEDTKAIVQELSNNFAKYYPIKNVSEINNQDLLVYAVKKIGWNEVIEKKEIENEITKILGTDTKINHEDIECSSAHDEKLYLYEDGKYRFNEKHGGHGGKTVYSSAFYVSGEKDKNIITVNYKILYSNVCSDTCVLTSYYRTYKDSLNDENPVLEGDPNSEDGPGVNLTEKLYKSVEVKIPVTTFTFEKTDDGYILKSVKIHE